MALSIVILLVSLAIILVSAELFTNAVEWLGLKLGLNEGVLGSVFAAVGTAMPETLIPIIAVGFGSGGGHGEAIGIGAILGAPFMLATLAMFITGLAAWLYSRSGRRPAQLNVDTSVLGRDIRFFLGAYLVAVALAFVPLIAARIVAAAGLVLFYVYYVYRHATEESQAHTLETELEAGTPVETNAEELGPLRFAPRASNPAGWLVGAQLLVSLVIMVVGARLFVDEVTEIADAVGIPALVLSLLIAPVATELPEKLNSIIWIRRGKDTLALGNISGAMVFQSCLPVSFGLVFTRWSADESLVAFVSAVLALLAGLLLFVTMRTGQRTLGAAPLMLCGLFYLAYVLYLGLVVLPSGTSATH